MGSPSNKHQLQTISKRYFINKSLECTKNTILSGFGTDADGEHNAIAITDQSIIQKRELNSLTEEADSRMIPHISKTGEEQNQ